MSGDRGPRVPVVFNDEFWADDMARASAAAKTVAGVARVRLETQGVELSSLKPCDDHDGAELHGLFKLYLPLGDPVGRWGLVLEPRKRDAGLFFFTWAFGVRHPPADSPRWSVYERAHYRRVEE